MKIVSQLREVLLGFDKNDLLSRMAEQQRRIADLESLFERVASGTPVQWLHANRLERMDALDPMFDKERRNFHLARYEYASRRVTGLDVADIACGTGYGSKMLVEEGKARQVVGIDIDPHAIEYGKESHGAAELTYVCASADATGLDSNSLDVVVSFETIEHLPPEVDLMREFSRILRPGGRLIISTPNDWPLTEHHLRTYNFISFSSELQRYFEIESVFNQNSGGESPYNHGQNAGITETNEGNAHLAECYIAVCTKPKA